MSSTHNDSSLASGEQVVSATQASSHTMNARHRVVIRVFSPLVRFLNPPIMRLAGSRRLPLFALLTHRGRHSGRAYSTPVGARPTADGFIVPMTFGEQADWFRNAQAAGACVIRWKGVDYAEGDPQIVGWSVARSAFSRRERAVLSMIGMTQFVRLTHRAEEPEERE